MDRLESILDLVKISGCRAQGGILLEDDRELDYKVYNENGIYHIVLEEAKDAQNRGIKE